MHQPGALCCCIHTHTHTHSQPAKEASAPPLEPWCATATSVHRSKSNSEARQEQEECLDGQQLLNGCVLCREGSDSSQHHDIVIHANELSYDNGLSTGDIIRYVLLIGTDQYTPVYKCSVATHTQLKALPMIPVTWLTPVTVS